MYEIAYLIRRAESEGEETVLLGEYHYHLSNAGKLLKLNEKSIHSSKEVIARLKIPEQFDDVVWELEVATMLKLIGCSTQLVVPTEGETYDISSQVTNRQIAIECKNKIIDDSVNKANNLFMHAISSKFENIQEFRKKNYSDNL